MPITTAASWKAYRRIASSEYDAPVGVLIPVVEAEIQRYIGRVINEATYTDEVYSGDGTQVLLLRNWPVTAISAVKYVSDSGTETTLAATDYRCITGTENRGELRRMPYSPPSIGAGRYVDEWRSQGCRPVWREGFGNYSVTYTAGYATVPGDVEMAAWALIDSHLEDQGFSIFTMTQAEGNENKAVRSAEDAKAAMHRLLAPYRRLP
jgi:hypothetical protein